MSLIEILIISIGLSLDVYAVVVCQGAVLLKIEKTKAYGIGGILLLISAIDVVLKYLV